MSYRPAFDDTAFIKNGSLLVSGNSPRLEGYTLVYRNVTLQQGVMIHSLEAPKQAQWDMAVPAADFDEAHPLLAFGMETHVREVVPGDLGTTPTFVSATWAENLTIKNLDVEQA